jgi:uncharacterized delta-60 repeat protein
MGPIYSQRQIAGIALQSDGKIVAVGGGFKGTVLARYNPDGSLDSNFGQDGLVVDPDFGRAPDVPGNIQGNPNDVLFVGLNYGVATRVVIQADGRILVAGGNVTGIPDVSQVQFALERYNPDGSADVTFGSGGKVLTDSNDVMAAGLALQADGDIVVAGGVQGYVFGPPRPQNITVARYDAAGNLDAGFGGGLVPIDGHLPNPGTVPDPGDAGPTNPPPAGTTAMDIVPGIPGSAALQPAQPATTGSSVGAGGLTSQGQGVGAGLKPEDVARGYSESGQALDRLFTAPVYGSSEVIGEQDGQDRPPETALVRQEADEALGGPDE